MSVRARIVLALLSVVVAASVVGLSVGVVKLFTGPSGPQTRILNASEQHTLELQGDLYSLDFKAVPQYSSLVEALVTHNNGYQPVQIQETDKAGDGIVLFAKCTAHQTRQECAATVPTTDNFHIYVSVSRDSEGRLLADNIVGYVATVNGTSLTCSPTSAFQPNPYSIRQVPNVFRAFSSNNNVRSGDMNVDFGNQSQDIFPAQGMVTWHCDTKAA